MAQHLSRTSSEWTDARARQLLRDMFSAAIASADPALALVDHLPDLPPGRVVVVGAGKAAAAMALAVETAWPDVPLTGVVVVPYGYGVSTRKIRVRAAAHPVPDTNSVEGARAVFEAVRHLTADDLVLALISGGGSSVLALPADGLTLEDKQAANRALLASGLDIRTMNVIRRRLSAIKGGKLAAAAAPARVVTLAISDIPGDDPGAIASGPTVPDTTTLLDIQWAIDRFKDSVPPVVVEHLQRPAQMTPSWPDCEFRMVATPAAALDAAAAVARAAGLDVQILGDDLEGEAREVGAAMASHAFEPARRPRVILSGGETTVTIGNARAGRGGRNSEFLLALTQALNGAPGVWALAGDTDGEDGASGGAAGAITAPDTIQRGMAAGLDIAAALETHDSGSYFDRLGDAIVTGPTRTNVNDFRAILIG